MRSFIYPDKKLVQRDLIEIPLLLDPTTTTTTEATTTTAAAAVGMCNK